MSAVTMHWAAMYLGRPWRSGARGPDAYYCWGLLQALCKRRLGLEMPEVATGTEQQQFPAILEAARGQGWHLVPVGDGPRADDIVLMRNRWGDRHCGFMVEADGRLGVMHADGHNTERGPIGEVVFETLAQAMNGGYSRIEFWRHA
jgi:cell wall-associated NlpC family hydrolase